jgi:hypothetical protein
MAYGVPLEAPTQGLIFLVSIDLLQLLDPENSRLIICLDFIFRLCPQRLEYGMPLAASPIGHFFRSLLWQ